MISLANHYNRSPDRISERDIEDFLLSLSRRHLAPASVRLAWNGIAFFYRHVLGRLAKDFHPVMPRQRQRQPEILSPQEVDAIIQQARRLRNRLLIILASKRSAPTHYRACIRHTISLQSPYAFLQFCPTAE